MRRRRHNAAQPLLQTAAHDRWLISYADFMTLLFAVFVVLFAYTMHTRQSVHSVSSAIHSGFESLSAHPPPDGPSPQPAPHPMPRTPMAGQPSFDVAKLSTQLHGILGDSISRREIVMQQTPDGLVISLRELGFFNSGEATLLPGAGDKLVNAAHLLIQQGLEVRVEGHSDDQPIHNSTFNSNWELSTARAMSVLSMFIDRAGFPPDRISVAGYGAFRPIGSNATPEGRRTNRRVDLVIVAPRTPEQRLP